MSELAVTLSPAAPAFATDGDLGRRAVEGDERSFVELFQRHGQSSWRVGVTLPGGGGSAGAGLCTGVSLPRVTVGCTSSTTQP